MTRGVGGVGGGWGGGGGGGGGGVGGGGGGGGGGGHSLHGGRLRPSHRRLQRKLPDTEPPSELFTIYRKEIQLFQIIHVHFKSGVVIYIFT